MTIKEFIGMQSEFAPKRVKFTVDGVIEISTECGEC